MRLRSIKLITAAALIVVIPSAPAIARHRNSPSAPKQHAPQGKLPPKAEDVLVWVDLNTSIYYLPGDSLWGRTLSGQYMSESAAKATGYRERQAGE